MNVEYYHIAEPSNRPNHRGDASQKHFVSNKTAKDEKQKQKM